MANHGMTNVQAAQIGAKTLWIGDIEPWMDENYVQGLFNGVSKYRFHLSRSRLSIQSNLYATKSKELQSVCFNFSNFGLGYGFVEFPNHEIAKNVYTSLNGATIPGTQRSFKLNWASHGASKPDGSTPAGGPNSQMPQPSAQYGAHL
jgi:hypothetical protein